RLNLPITDAKAVVGTAQARLSVEASHTKHPLLTAHVHARDSELAQVLAAPGVHRDMRGGKSRLVLDIESRGVSPRQWASGATGNVLAVAGPATLVNSKSAPKEPLNELARAVNPFHDVDAATDLQGAVVRLPFHNGV